MSAIRTDRIHEKAVMHCGMECEIIAYRNRHDIDVKFTDGTTLFNKSYINFQLRTIQNPNIDKKYMSDGKSKKDERLHQSIYQNCGYTATIIEYRSAKDIDIEFDDIKHTKLYHKEYKSFISGMIKFSDDYKLKHINEKNHMNCGMDAMIIRYINRENIDIEFEDSVIVKDKQYPNFVCGKIKHPNLKNGKIFHGYRILCSRPNITNGNAYYLVLDLYDNTEKHLTPQMMMEKGYKL